MGQILPEITGMDWLLFVELLFSLVILLLLFTPGSSENKHLNRLSRDAIFPQAARLSCQLTLAAISTGEERASRPNVSQPSVLTSFNVIWFRARSHYGPNKTTTLSNICLPCEPVDYSFSWRSDGTRLTQPHAQANKSISAATMSNRMCFKV